MANLETRQFDGADGVRIRADVGGDPQALCVVLLHGGGQLRQSWGNTARALVEAGRYVVSIDLRGHGDSDWSLSGDYDLDAFVRDLSAILEQLPSAPVLVGASLGGLTSLVLTGESPPARIRALVLVDITTRPDPAGVEKISTFMKAAPDGFSSVEEAADAVAMYLPDRPRPADPSGLLRNLREHNGRLYWHWDPGFFSSDRRINTETQRLEAAARAVRVPTLLVWGLRSEIVSQESVRQFRSLLPDAEIAEVKDAGHMVAGDRNDAFSGAVIDFLARVTSSPE